MNLSTEVALPRVLIIEDDDAVRSALGFSLELEGFDVEGFRSGEDLLGQDVSAACVVLDQRLPGLSGLQTLAQLRQKQPGMPGILMTSHPSRHLLQAASNAGVPVLEKPLLGDTLCAEIRAQIAAHQPT